MSKFSRRDFVKIVGGTAAATAVGLPAFTAAAGSKKVVIVGGGTAGATAAKYIKRGDSSIDVTVIEPNKDYYTCYLSNEVLGGGRKLESIRFGYDGLKGHGVNVVHDMVTAIELGDLERGYTPIDIQGNDERLHSLSCPLMLGPIIVHPFSSVFPFPSCLLFSFTFTLFLSSSFHPFSSICVSLPLLSSSSLSSLPPLYLSSFLLFLLSDHSLALFSSFPPIFLHPPILPVLAFLFLFSGPPQPSH